MVFIGFWTFFKWNFTEMENVTFSNPFQGCTWHLNLSLMQYV